VIESGALLLRLLTSRFWRETAVLCVPANVCSWGKSGRAADITAKTDFELKRSSEAVIGPAYCPYSQTARSKRGIISPSHE
jgi:hypothetical protein